MVPYRIDLTLDARFRGDDACFVEFAPQPLMCGNRQPHLGLPLQCANDAEEALSVWVTARPEHAMQALAGFLDLVSELFEPNRRIDEITQHCLSRCSIAGKVGIERLSEQRLTELRVALRPRQDCLLEISSKCHRLVLITSARGTHG